MSDNDGKASWGCGGGGIGSVKTETREEALKWLVENVDEWPEIWADHLLSGVSGWDWVGSQKGDVIFAPTSLAKEITKDDWLAAQSKADELVWDGAGNPPVGLNCEILLSGSGVWHSWKGIAIDGNVYFGYIDTNATGIDLARDYLFRKLKSDAEIHKEETISDIVDCLKILYTGPQLYSAIKDGKIRHVNLQE